MAKINPDHLGSITNENSFLETLNANFDDIQEVAENFLSRDGTTPNEMNTDLDMNSHQIMNLPEATTSSEPVRKAEFDDLEGRVDDVENSIGAIDDQLTAATALVTAAQNAVDQAQTLDNYYVSIWADSLIEPSEQLLDHLFTDTIVFPASLSGSRAECRTNATGAKQFSIKKEDVEFATITFSPGSGNGSFSASSETTFNAGEVLSIVGPASTDATLAGIRITLIGNVD